MKVLGEFRGILGWIPGIEGRGRLLGAWWLGVCEQKMFLDGFSPGFVPLLSLGLKVVKGQGMGRSATIGRAWRKR